MFYDPTNWYWTVNDTNPGTSVWKSPAAAFVTLSDAGFLAWLSQPITSIEERQNQPILAAASNGSGGTRLTINTTQSAPFAMTTGMVVNVSGTGTYDGNQAITVIDATHIDIAVAFVANATGTIIYATIIDTNANLETLIGNYNSLQWATIPQSNTLSLSGNTTLTVAQLAKQIVITNTSGSFISVKLPSVLLPGSIPLGGRIVIVNASSGSVNDVVIVESSTGFSLSTWFLYAFGSFVDTSPQDFTNTNWLNFAYPLGPPSFLQATAGQILIGQAPVSGASAMSVETITGDATITAAGLVTVSSVNNGAAWTVFTATATPSAGAITTQSSDSAYLKLGKFVAIRINVTLSNIGTASGTITINLPFTVGGSTVQVISGRETANTKAIHASLPTGTNATGALRNYDGTNVAISNGIEYVINGVFEAA